MPQTEAQQPVVAAGKEIVPVAPAVRLAIGPRHRKKPRAQHRRQRQRDEHGRQDSDRHHHCELVEDTADDTAHQKHGDEHRHQRYRDGDDGEPDLARALERGIEGGETVLLHMAEDVFQHDDSVVDDEADRQRQSHQRYVVDGEAEQEHRAERGDQGNWHSHGWNDRRGDTAKEDEDHYHDKRDGEQQRELDVVDRCADRR